MTQAEIKKELKIRFNELFPGKRLLAIQLNGFTHSVFYDERSPRAKVLNPRQLVYSGCMSESERASYGMNVQYDNLTKLFSGYPNYKYQGNAKEIVYVRP